MKELESMPKPGLCDNGFGSTWLGNLVAKLGGDPTKIYCRGEWTYMHYTDGELTIDIESAWDEPKEVRQFLEEQFPDISIFYQCEEPGNCIFTTNDPTGDYFPDRYYLWDEIAMDNDYFGSLEALLKAVEEKTGSKHITTFKAAEKAMATYSRKNDGSSYDIQEFEYCE